MTAEQIDAIERLLQAVEARNLGGWDGLYEDDISTVRAFVSYARAQGSGLLTVGVEPVV